MAKTLNEIFARLDDDKANRALETNRERQKKQEEAERERRERQAKAFRHLVKGVDIREAQRAQHKPAQKNTERRPCVSSAF